MFIAIPSLDKSFTCTLFMSASQFDAIDRNSAKLVPFFEEYFPGVVDTLINKSDLEEQYHSNPHLPLISIKCGPYHYNSSAVILGDAAHAMVPFYGQGMNAGLEDVRVLFEVLDEHANDSSARATALSEYTTLRQPDAHAINDLAMGNYQEMRSDVRSPWYLLRKKTEEALNVWFPSLGFVTQYTRISFSNQRYSEVQEAVTKQGMQLSAAGFLLSAVAVTGTLATIWRLRLQ